MSFSISTSYVGKSATEFISKALLDGKTLKGNYITLIPNIKKSYKLQILDEGNLIQADGCSFNASGTITISERTLDPKKLKVNTEACVTDLESHWVAEQMKAGANNDNITFLSYIIDRYAANVAQSMDYLIWQGDSGVADGTAGSGGIYSTYPFLTQDDGLVVKAKADSNTVKVTGTTLTAANIIAELAKVYAVIPDQILAKTDLKWFISHKASKFYKQALASIASQSLFNITQDQPLTYLGIELVPVNIADNAMFVASISNIFFGTDLLSDEMEVKTLDMRDLDGSDNVRFKMRFSSAVNFAIPTEIVLYS